MMNRDEYRSRAKELASRGSDRPNARLNPKLVGYIRSNPDRLTARELGVDLGVHHRTIEKVRYFETWVHV